jgi:membrane-bound inhibitor of C-type lysozyme
MVECGGVWWSKGAEGEVIDIHIMRVSEGGVININTMRVSEGA